MKFPEVVRNADDETPVWARSRRRRGGNPLIAFLVTLLALFGALTLILAIKEKSAAEGGAIIDGWASSAWGAIKELTGQADEVAAEGATVAAEEAGQALQSAGEAIENGAGKTVDAVRDAAPEKK